MILRGYSQAVVSRGPAPGPKRAGAIIILSKIVPAPRLQCWYNTKYLSSGTRREPQHQSLRAGAVEILE